MTFYQWAMTKRITNTPRGDFLQDMRWDEYAKLVENTKDAWERNLASRGEDERARIAFRSLWGSYCNQCGDPGQQEEVIAERTRMFFELAAVR